MDEVVSTGKASKSRDPQAKGGGRRKIEVRKIENKHQKWVTLSKRKKGLFSKAAQLSRLSGQAIGVIVVSEQGRTYISENADTVFQQYMSIKDREDRQKEGQDRDDTAERESMVLDVVKKPQVGPLRDSSEGTLHDSSTSKEPTTEGESDIKFVMDLNKLPAELEEFF